MSEVLRYLQDNHDNIFKTIEKYVKTESPSNRKDLIDKCGEVLEGIFSELLGIKVTEKFQQEQTGNHLKFSYGEGDEQILILSHMDTVWDPGRLTLRIEGDKAYGPGIFDMKSGSIQAIWAVKALKDLGLTPNKKIVFLFNTDEEIGSPTSRKIIEEEAKRSKVVLVAEPPGEKGEIKTARKGVGIFKIKIKGVASHAGNNHEKGISAIEELAHQVIKLHSLTDYSVGSTVNVGVIKGGSRTNVVADEAEGDIDFRVETFAEAERLEKAIRNLEPKLKGTTIQVEGEFNRPPMERTALTGEYFEKARKIAASLGFELAETSVGGGSDGNFTAALGIPTLDGLGAVGEGPHAEHEHILIDQLPNRTALFAHLLMEL